MQNLHDSEIIGINNTFSESRNVYIDNKRMLNISNSIINNSDPGAFSLSGICGEVTNAINQLPRFENEPDKKELKELLSQLQNVVLRENLDLEETIETLEKIKTIANALQDSQDVVMRRTAKISMKILRAIATDLPPNATMVNLCNQLPSLITKIF